MPLDVPRKGRTLGPVERTQACDRQARRTAYLHPQSPALPQHSLFGMGRPEGRGLICSLLRTTGGLYAWPYRDARASPEAPHQQASAAG